MLPVFRFVTRFVAGGTADLLMVTSGLSDLVYWSDNYKVLYLGAARKGNKDARDRGHTLTTVPRLIYKQCNHPISHIFTLGHSNPPISSSY